MPAASAPVAPSLAPLARHARARLGALLATSLVLHSAVIATLPNNIARLNSSTPQALEARLIAAPAPPKSEASAVLDPGPRENQAPAPTEKRARAEQRADASQADSARPTQPAPDAVTPEPAPELTAPEPVATSTPPPGDAEPADNAAQSAVTALAPEVIAPAEIAAAPTTEVVAPEPPAESVPNPFAPTPEPLAADQAREATPTIEAAASVDDAAAAAAAAAHAAALAEAAARDAARLAPAEVTAEGELPPAGNASDPPATLPTTPATPAALASPQSDPAPPQSASSPEPARTAPQPSTEQLARALESSVATQSRSIALPQSLEVDYVLRRSEKGLDLGRMKLSWTLEDQRYTLTTVAEAAGLLALFMPGKHVQISTGQITAAGLAPERFREERTGKANHIDSVQFDRANGLLLYDGRAGEKSVPLPEGTQDTLSFLMQFALDPPKSGVVASSITTGRKLENFTYEIAGRETLQLAGEALETLRLTPKDTKGRNSIEVWLAIDRHHFPVKLRVVDRKGNIVEQIATRIQVK